MTFLLILGIVALIGLIVVSGMEKAIPCPVCTTPMVPVKGDENPKVRCTCPHCGFKERRTKTRIAGQRK